MEACNCVLLILSIVLAVAGKYLAFYGIRAVSTVTIFFENYAEPPIAISCLPYILVALGAITALLGWCICASSCSENRKFAKSVANCLASLIIIKIICIVVLYTDFVFAAGKAYVDNFPDEMYFQGLVALAVYLFLGVMVLAFRRLLIFYVLGEALVLVCAWCCISKKKVVMPTPTLTTVTVQSVENQMPVH